MKLLHAIARLVPEAQRVDWLREWTAEWRWHQNHRPVGRWRGVRRIAGALRHAAWLRLDDWSLHMLGHDLRFSLRMLARRPSVTVMAVLTLALALGAGAAIFSVVDAVQLQALPFRDPDRLVMLRYEYTDTGRQNDYISIPDFFDWRGAEAFTGLAAVDWPLSRTLTGGGEPLKLRAARATPGFFALLGVQPVEGRGLDGGAAAGADTVLISHDLWQRRFGGDPDLIGRTITLDDIPRVVTGILPAGLDLPTPADVWLPFDTSPASARRRVNLLKVFGRLHEEASLEQAQVEMTTIARRLAVSFPDTNATHGVAIVPLREAWLGSDLRPLALMLGAVGLLLILAVANVANLLLVRLVSREGEIAVRTLLGASRSRLWRQLVLEQLLLVGTAAALGLGAAHLGIDLVRTLLPADLPRAGGIHVDARVIAVTAVVSVCVAVSLAALFARRSSRRAAGTADGRGLGGASSRARLRGGLVGVQVAAATVLLIGATLFGRSVLALHQVDPGFRTSGVWSFRISLPDEAYPESGDVVAFFADTMRELRALPGVDAAEIASALPLAGNSRSTGIHAEVGTATEVSAGFVAVSAGYFDAMDIPLAAGREFRPGDSEGAPEVVVVDEALASALWPDGRAVGQRLSRSGPGGPWVTVVGVVGNVRHRSLRDPPTPTLYSPHAQRGWDTMDVVLTTSGNDAGLPEIVPARMAALAPAVPVEGLRPIEALVSTSTAPIRLQSVLLGVFGTIAAVVAALGIYAIAAYAVQRRAPEIGLRIALGATRADVLRLVLRQGLLQVAAGLALGLAAAVASRHVVAGLLFGVAPADPWSLTAVVVLLGSVAAVATYLPARRAAGLDPARTLLGPDG